MNECGLAGVLPRRTSTWGFAQWKGAALVLEWLGRYEEALAEIRTGVVARFVQNRTLTGHAYDACLWQRF
jgi:hypothetical protein